MYDFLRLSVSGIVTFGALNETGNVSIYTHTRDINTSTPHPLNKSQQLGIDVLISEITGRFITLELNYSNLLLYPDNW